MAPTNIVQPSGYHPATFGDFTIERRFKAAPARVFKAWADPAAKAAWFAGGPEWKQEIREFDFREGGSDRLRGKWPSGMISDFRNTYCEIIPDKRIVYAYEMHLNDIRLSLSLATIELSLDGSGTLMKLTEQGAFLAPFDKDGDDLGSRKRGTIELVEKMAAWVDGN